MTASPLRNAIVVFALAALPGFAAAAGSQAGDNGRQPVGADNDGPRMAIPNESTQAGEWQSYNSNGYYDPYRQPHVYVGDAPQTYYAPPPTAYYYYPAPQYHYYAPPGYYVSPYPPTGSYYAYSEADRARALTNCDNLPLADRPACRDAVVYGR